MALIVEDGTGKADAESYDSVANALAYLGKFASAPVFGTKTTAEQEAAMRAATRFLDVEFSGRWRGSRVYETQALDWPRAGAHDRDDYLIDHDEIPQRLKDATAALAERAVAEDLIPDQGKPGGIKAKRVKAGSVEVDTEYAGAQAQEKFYRLAEGLVADLIHSSMTLRRG